MYQNKASKIFINIKILEIQKEDFEHIRKKYKSRQKR